MSNMSFIKSKSKINQTELTACVIEFFRIHFPKSVPEVKLSSNPDIALHFKFGELIVPVWVSSIRVEMFSTSYTALSRTHSDKTLIEYFDKIKNGLGSVPMSTTLDGYAFIHETVKKAIAAKYSEGFINDEAIGKYHAQLEQNLNFSAWIKKAKEGEEVEQKKSSIFSTFWINQPSLDDIERVQKDIWKNLINEE